MNREQLKLWVAALLKGRRHPASEQVAKDELQRVGQEARPPHRRAERRA